MSCSNMTFGVDTYYRERANGRWEYWTYSDGRRIYVTEKIITQGVKQGDKIVYVK